MSTDAPAHIGATRARRPTRARPGATIPTQIIDRLRGVTDPADQLGAIAHHALPELVRKIAWQVGHAKAEDLAMDVIERHLAEHRKNPRDSYCTVEDYHRLRASLVRSTVNASIDHLRRKSTRVELPIGSFGEDYTHSKVVRAGGEMIADDAEDGPHHRFDAAALYDGLRRVDTRDAELLRMKLDGSTFAELADHLGVRSTNAAYKRYQRAMSAVQTVLERYGAGGYCADHGSYLLLLRQEVAFSGDGGEQPLTDMVGQERALGIRMHVYGDPAIASDDGCAGCRKAGQEHEMILGSFLPPPLLLVPAAGVIPAVTGALAGAWSALSGWFGGLLGGGGGGAAAGVGVATKGAALVAAATVAVGGAITIHTVVDGAPAKSVPVKAFGRDPTPSVTIEPRRPAPVHTSIPKPAAARRAASRPPAAGSARDEFAPTPQPRTSVTRAPRTSGGGSAVGEFTPEP